MVSPVTDLRQRAAEHLEWARTARSVHERKLFVQMAQAWLDAAKQAEEAAEVIAASCPGSDEMIAPGP
jgi:hypothetical protein